MFFNIGPTKLHNFPVQHCHNNIVINLDTGWKQSTDKYNNRLYYKGYIDAGRLEDYLDDISEQEEPYYTGNFCLIKSFDNGITIKTDRYRSFPIWYDSKLGLNNLTPYETTCWTDSFVSLTNSLEKVESKFDAIGQINSTNLSINDAIDAIDSLLTDKFAIFFKYNTMPIKVFLSGGIDTMTLYSYILKLKIPHQLVACFHTDLDYFYLKNHGTLAQFWGYKQFHYWSTPSMLLSGTPGDEFTVRSPTTANMILKFYDTSIDILLNEKKDSLHFKYFEKYVDIFESQKDLKFDSLEQVIKQCLNIILNDYQHWHLGETISYTPLRDINLFKVIARLNKDNLIDQIFNSKIQKELIRRNAPELIDGLSKDKNSSNYLENLTKILVERPQDNSH